MTDTLIAPRRRRLAAGAAAVLAATTLTACGSNGAETTTIRYQSEMGSVDLIQMGEALHDFPGLTFKKVGDETGGPQTLQALVSNQIDVSGPSFFGAIAQLVATGAPIKAVVSDYGSNAKNNSSVVTLAGSPIKKPQQLIGKKVAVNTLGANEEAIIDTWLRKSGLSSAQIKQVTLVPLPPLNTVEALQQHQVDAAALDTGQIQAVHNKVKFATLVKDTSLLGPYNGGGAAMTDSFMQQNPKTTKKLVTGLAKALHYVETHSRKQVLSVYTTWLEQHGYKAYVAPVEANYPGDLGVASKWGVIKPGDISQWISWLTSRGDVKPSDVKPSDVYTNTFNQEAK